MKIILIIITVIILTGVIYFIYLGFKSQTGTPIGLIDNRLSPCPSTPNCICTEYPNDESHFTEAITFSAENADSVPTIMANAIEQTGGVITKAENNYIAATYTSKLFRYVDDFEVRIDKNKQLIHMRSASRVGKSDFGANLKRIESLRVFLLNLST